MTKQQETDALFVIRLIINIFVYCIKHLKKQNKGDNTVVEVSI